MLCYGLVLLAGYLHAEALIVDDLSDGKSRGYKLAGGKFVAQGWQATSSSAILYDLGKLVDNGGAAIIVTNFDPPSQNTSDKHKFFGGFSSTLRDYNFGDANYPDAWAIRCGNNYTAFKVTVGMNISKQSEVRCGSDNFDKSATYVFKHTWAPDGTDKTYFNQQLIDTQKMPRGMKIRYIDVANARFPSYPTLPGPVYMKFIVWEGAEPANLKGLTESGATSATAGLTLAVSRKSLPAAGLSIYSKEAMFKTGWLDLIGRERPDEIIGAARNAEVYGVFIFR